MRSKAVVVLLATCICAGCTGLEPAVIGAAASATKAGAVVFSKGRISAAAIVDYERVQDAIGRASVDLSLELVYEREDEVWSKYIMRDDLKKRITVRIRRRSATMTQVDIDVGRFGNEAIGRLFLLRLAAQMPNSGLDEIMGDTDSSVVTDPDD